MLANIRIVLVEPSHPGNIGAAARAMKTMSLQQLALVNPQAFPHEDATSRASGAEDILVNAQIVNSLSEAIADCAVVMGTSARLRSMQWPQYDPRSAASLLHERCQSGQRVALVFGRERTGLTNKELDLCQSLVTIPCNEQFSSLNLGAAVQVMCYEIFSHFSGHDDAGPKEHSFCGVPQAEMEGFYEHLQDTLVELEFLDPQKPKKLMHRLRRLFNRASPDQTEINILRGILTAMNKHSQTNKSPR